MIRRCFVATVFIEHTSAAHIPEHLSTVFTPKIASRTNSWNMICRWQKQANFSGPGTLQKPLSSSKWWQTSDAVAWLWAMDRVKPEALSSNLITTYLHDCTDFSRHRRYNIGPMSILQLRMETYNKHGRDYVPIVLVQDKAVDVELQVVLDTLRLWQVL